MKFNDFEGAYETFSRLKREWPKDTRAKTCDDLLLEADGKRR